MNTTMTATGQQEARPMWPVVLIVIVAAALIVAFLFDVPPFAAFANESDAATSADDAPAHASPERVAGVAADASYPLRR